MSPVVEYPASFLHSRILLWDHGKNFHVEHSEKTPPQKQKISNTANVATILVCIYFVQTNVNITYFYFFRWQLVVI